VGYITEEIFKGISGAVSSDKMDDYQHYIKWSKYGNYKKVVLKATEEELKEFIATETKCRYVIDAGKTQIAPNSLTVVGFFPRPDMAEKMKKFKLL
jgi:peptidyl-tRNA hydrolase